MLDRITRTLLWIILKEHEKTTHGCWWHLVIIKATRRTSDLEGGYEFLQPTAWYSCHGKSTHSFGKVTTTLEYTWILYTFRSYCVWIMYCICTLTMIVRWQLLFKSCIESLGMFRVYSSLCNLIYIYIYMTIPDCASKHVFHVRCLFSCG